MEATGEWVRTTKERARARRQKRRPTCLCGRQRQQRQRRALRTPLPRGERRGGRCGGRARRSVGRAVGGLDAGGGLGAHVLGERLLPVVALRSAYPRLGQKHAAPRLQHHGLLHRCHIALKVELATCYRRGCCWLSRWRWWRVRHTRANRRETPHHCFSRLARCRRAADRQSVEVGMHGSAGRASAVATTPRHVRAAIRAAGAAAASLNVRAARASKLLEISISGRRGTDLKLRRPSSRDAETQDAKVWRTSSHPPPRHRLHRRGRPPPRCLLFLLRRRLANCGARREEVGQPTDSSIDEPRLRSLTLRRHLAIKPRRRRLTPRRQPSNGTLAVVRRRRRRRRRRLRRRLCRLRRRPSTLRHRLVILPAKLACLRQLTHRQVVRNPLRTVGAARCRWLRRRWRARGDNGAPVRTLDVPGDRWR